MATMNVSLPQQMRDWVDAQVATGRYANASDYMRDLLRRDQEQARLTSLQAVVDSALASGASFRDRDQLMQHARTEAVAMLGERDGNKKNVA